MELIKAFPHLSTTDLFNMAVFYNNEEDVEYLLSNTEINYINADFILDCIERSKNIDMLTRIISRVGSTRIFTYNNIARKFPSMIPFLIGMLKSEGKVERRIISDFIDVAIDSNSKEVMESLLEFRDHLNKYQYTVLLCGVGSVRDVIDRMDTVNEIPDECIETAYLCENLQVLDYLRDTVRINNICLGKIIRKDVY